MALQKPEKENHTKLHFWVTFFIVFVVGMVLIFLISYLDTRSQFKQVIGRIHLTLMNEQKLIRSTLHRNISDILFLRDQVSKDLDYPDAKAMIDKSLMSFSRFHPEYDQVRFLNSKGQEIARVNHRGGRVVIVSDDELQNKKHRYYFEKSFAKGKDQVYFSRLDLNKENKKIEHPFRPMIRIGTPVFSTDGKKVGVVLLNYNAIILLKRIRDLSSTMPGKWYVVNNEGYVLQSIDPSQEWGNMLTDRKHITFSALYPSLSHQLMSTGRDEAVISRDGVLQQHVISTAFKNAQAKDLNLSVIWIVPWDQLVPTAIYFYIAAGILVLALLGVILWYVFKSRAQHLAHEHALEFISKIDPLTQVLNRRALFSLGNMEVKHAKRTQRSFSVLMLDIDSFKKVNDTYGHKYGDRALSLLAKMLKNNVREVDLIGRYGGEEFVIILHETPLDLATTVAEKLLLKIREIQVPYKDMHFSFTASVGVSQWSGADVNLTTTINRSDEAMYMAKETGRNQVVNESALSDKSL